MDPNEIEDEDLRNYVLSLQEQNQNLQSESTKTQRELAFERAGVPGDGPGKYFRQGYDGDLDPEKIRAQALADGIITEPAGGETPPPEQEAHQGMAGGGEAPPPPDLRSHLAVAAKAMDDAARTGDVSALEMAQYDFDKTVEQLGLAHDPRQAGHPAETIPAPQLAGDGVISPTPIN